MSSYLANLSDSERKEFLESAQLARAAKREEGIFYAHKHLKLDYADEQHWKDLGSKLKVRRFQWYEPANVKNIRKAIKKVGRDAAWFTSVFGFSTYAEHVEANPEMTANALLGFVCEEVNEEAGN